MTVIKIRQQKEFSTLSNKILQDTNLSIEAIGLWSHCMSRPEDWTFYVKQLCTQFGIGKEKLHKIVNELIDNGYAFRGQRMETKEHSLAGNRKVFSSIEYVFFPHKISQEEYENLKKEYPGSEFKKCFSNGNLPLPESPLPENPPLQKKEEIQIKDQEREEQAPLSPSPSLPSSCNFYKDKFEGRVKITDESRKRLSEKFGSESLVDEYAEKLYRWSYDNEKEYKKKKRHDLTIETWMEKDGIKKPSSGNVNESQKQPPSKIKTPEETAREHKIWYKEKFRKYHWNLIETGVINEESVDHIEIKIRNGKVVRAYYEEQNFPKDLNWMVKNI